MVCKTIAIYLNEKDYIVYNSNKEHINDIARKTIKKQIKKLKGETNGNKNIRQEVQD